MARYRKNVKRTDPRYFLHEKATMELNEAQSPEDVVAGVKAKKPRHHHRVMETWDSAAAGDPDTLNMLSEYIPHVDQSFAQRVVNAYPPEERPAPSY